jgi:hypothetical protein
LKNFVFLSSSRFVRLLAWFECCHCLCRVSFIIIVLYIVRKPCCAPI